MSPPFFEIPSVMKGFFFGYGRNKIL